MTGKTKSGFVYTLDDDILDDMELLDAMAEAGDTIASPSKFVLKVLGKKQRKALYDHIRDDKGKVRPERVMDEIKEMFEGLGKAGKNS